MPDQVHSPLDETLRERFASAVLASGGVRLEADDELRRSITFKPDKTAQLLRVTCSITGNT